MAIDHVSCAADYMLLCVCASTGLTRTTREHLAVAVALEIPVAVAVTKADVVEEQQLQQVLAGLKDLLATAAAGGGGAGGGATAVGRAGAGAGGIDGDEEVGCAAGGGGGGEGRATAAAGAGAGGDGVNRNSSEAATSAAGCMQEAVCIDALVGEGKMTEQRQGLGEELRKDVSSMAMSVGGASIITCEASAKTAAQQLSRLHAMTGSRAGGSFLQVTFPVFLVSSVTGAGLPLVHAFLSGLEPASSLWEGQGVEGGVLGGVGSIGSSSGVIAVAPPAAAATAGGGGGSVDANGEEVGAVAASRSSELWGFEPSGVCEVMDGAGVAAAAARPPLVAVDAAPGAETPPAAAGDGGLAAAGGGDGSLPVAAAAAAGGGGGGGSSNGRGHFQVVHTFDVDGVGPVVSGITVSGKVGHEQKGFEDYIHM